MKIDFGECKVDVVQIAGAIGEKHFTVVTLGGEELQSVVSFNTGEPFPVQHLCSSGKKCKLVLEVDDD